MSVYQIPDSTQVEERLRILEGEVDRAMATPEFQRIAARLDASVPANAPNRGWRLAEAALAQAQSYPYRPDPPGEWFQTGVETTEKGGDCEDLSVAFVALSRLLGPSPRLAWIMQPQQALNHVTAAFGPDQAPIWADASLRGARLGESPYDAKRRLGNTAVQGV